MGIENLHDDEYRIWGMDRNGIRAFTERGFAKDWNKIREEYLAKYPNCIYVRLDIAIPDKEAIAAGLTRAQLAEKASG